MSLELMALPLAFMAGVVGILSPCVWPLVPVVVASSATTGRFGPLALAGGLSLSFAVAGSVLMFFLVNMGLDPELFRYIAAVVLLAAGVVLVFKPLANRMTLGLSFLTSRWNLDANAERGYGQFGVGVLLGVVWLPCVGPTMGAAIGLASMGQQMGLAFLVMLMFGMGTAAVLLAAGLLSSRAIVRWNAAAMSGADTGKRLLGWTLLLLGGLVLTGVDKVLQTWAVQMLPGWATGL
jgi:cytochrome c biogenesis protein CcdA